MGVEKIKNEILAMWDSVLGGDYVFTVDGVPAETVRDVYHETSVVEILGDMKENGHELASNEAYIRIKDLPENVRMRHYTEFIEFNYKQNLKK